MSESMREIARRIKKLRHDAKMSVSDLARKGGLSTITIYRLERGEGNSSEETMGAVAGVFGMTIDKLLETASGEAPITRPKSLKAIPAKRPIATKVDGCVNRLCQKGLAPHLADFLGHDVLGHKALNALIGFTDVKLPEDLKALSDKDLRCLPNVGVGTRNRIRERMTGPDDVQSTAETAAIITELTSSSLICNVRRTPNGFNALVYLDGDEWYDVEIVMSFKKETPPENFIAWDKSSQ